MHQKKELLDFRRILTQEAKTAGVILKLLLKEQKINP
jgi:hypothetical protein